MISSKGKLSTGDLIDLLKIYSISSDVVKVDILSKYGKEMGLIYWDDEYLSPKEVSNNILNIISKNFNNFLSDVRGYSIYDVVSFPLSVKISDNLTEMYFRKDCSYFDITLKDGLLMVSISGEKNFISIRDLDYFIDKPKTFKEDLDKLKELCKDISDINYILEVFHEIKYSSNYLLDEDTILNSNNILDKYNYSDYKYLKKVSLITNNRQIKNYIDGDKNPVYIFKKMILPILYRDIKLLRDKIYKENIYGIKQEVSNKIDKINDEILRDKSFRESMDNIVKGIDKLYGIKLDYGIYSDDNLDKLKEEVFIELSNSFETFLLNQ